MSEDAYENLCLMKWIVPYYLDNPASLSLAQELESAENDIDDLVRKVQKQESQARRSDTAIANYLEFKQDAAAHSRLLIDRRRKIAEEFNAKSSAYAYLHDDILTIIFDYATTGVQSSDTFPRQRKLSSTLRIAAVTRQWRNTALNSWFLWSSLPISYWNNDVFQTFLARSKAGPLDIRIEISYDWVYNQAAYNHTLRSIAHRVQFLCIQGDRLPVQYKNWLDLSFPIATTLSINSDQPQPLFDSPATTHLRGNAGTLQAFSAHKITCLDLTHVSITTLQFIFQTFLRLKTLKADMKSGEHIRVADDGKLRSSSAILTRRTHTALETLDINGGSVLHMLTLPNLKSLCLWSDHDALPPFLTRSRCTLARFGVDQHSDLGAMLANHTITEMVIRAYSLDQCGRVFDRLNPLLTNTSHLRCITMFVDNFAQGTPFESTEPYLFAPFLFFYHAHGSRFDWISIETPLPGEFLRLWSGLSNVFPRNIFVNDHPMDHFYRPVPHLVTKYYH